MAVCTPWAVKKSCSVSVRAELGTRASATADEGQAADVRQARQSRWQLCPHLVLLLVGLCRGHRPPSWLRPMPPPLPLPLPLLVYAGRLSAWHTHTALS